MIYHQSRILTIVNHTLSACGLAEHVTSDLLESIGEACRDNSRSTSPHATGRDKIIEYQLNNTRRKSPRGHLM